MHCCSFVSTYRRYVYLYLHCTQQVLLQVQSTNLHHLKIEIESISKIRMTDTDQINRLKCCVTPPTTWVGMKPQHTHQKFTVSPCSNKNHGIVECVKLDIIRFRCSVSSIYVSAFSLHVINIAINIKTIISYCALMIRTKR